MPLIVICPKCRKCEVAQPQEETGNRRCSRCGNWAREKWYYSVQSARTSIQTKLRAQRKRHSGLADLERYEQAMAEKRSRQVS